ncbi:carbohydrate ABC transporter permease [Actinacidiphila sp. bgisy144]|uniref:carbohydrate ABC transporter permease n=1 Tax=Actinacidiphila sp. bgisy144 TaxID=3413791 RepID=UPI003EB9EA18
MTEHLVRPPRTGPPPPTSGRPRSAAVRPARRTGPGLLARVKAGRWSYLYLTPFVLLVAAFTLYPIGASLVYTLFQWNGVGSPSHYVGLANFRQVIHDHVFWRSFGHTFQYTLVLVPLQLLLALVLAVVLNNKKLRFSTFYRSVFFLPAVMSPAIIAVVFQLMLSNFGDSINAWLIKGHLMHHQVDWLGDPHTVMWVVIAIGIWNTLGYNLVYFLAGLQSIPEELYEAASLDGAGAWSKFWHVTLPGLREVGLMILFLATLGSLQVFDLVQVLTGGGPYYSSSVVNTYIYQEAFGGGLSAGGAGINVQPNVGFASAASFFYGLILMVITVSQALLLRRMRARRNAARGVREGQ